MSSFERKLDGAAGAGDAGSDEPRALQSRFASMFSHVPASVRKRLQGESFRGVEVEEGSTDHRYYVVLEDLDVTCCGNIGTSGKVCIKAREDCDVIKHGRDRNARMAPGIYLRGNGEEVHVDPFIPKDSLPPKVVQTFLAEKHDSEFSARNAIVAICETIDFANLPMDTESPYGENKKAVRSSVSPVRKRIKRIDLREKFAEIVENSPSGKIEKFENHESKWLFDLQLKRDIFLKLLSSAVAEGQEDLDSLLDKIVELNSQLGIQPADSPPGLWVGIMELKQEMELIRKSLQDKAPSALSSAFTLMDGRLSSSINLLDGRLLTLDKSLMETKAETRDALIELAEEVEARSNPDVGAKDKEMLNKDENPFDFILDRVEKLTDMCNSFSKQDKHSSTGVKIGRYSFENIDELNGWCEQHLPPEFPFGAFVDIYSFLQRIKSFRDIADPDSLKSMDYRNKLDLTADEAITLEAFSHPLPKGFRGTTSEEGQMSFWIPGIKVPEKWEDKNGTVGVKIMIKENVEVVRTRVLAVIKHRLAGYPEATALARELLSDTIAFISELSEFISDTLRTLRQAGFEKGNAWSLVSKLIHRVLGVDCYLKRGISFELQDARAHKALAVSVLWGTFGTHQVLRGYQQHGIENHPSMSSEYVRFLVAHTDANKIDALEQKVKGLESQCKRWETDARKLEKEVENSKKSITTANNKLEDLRKVVSKIQQGK